MSVCPAGHWAPIGRGPRRCAGWAPAGEHGQRRGTWESQPQGEGAVPSSRVSVCRRPWMLSWAVFAADSSTR